MQSPGSLPFALASFLADDCSPDSRLALTPCVQAQILQLAGKAFREIIAQLIVLIAPVTLQCLLFATLPAVQKIGSLEPQVTQRSNVQAPRSIVFPDVQLACLSRLSDKSVCNAGIVQQGGNLLGFRIPDLDKHARVLCKQQLHHVLFLQERQIHLQTGTVVRKAHFQQGNNHAACRNVMPGKHHALLHQRLHRFKSPCEIGTVLHVRHMPAHFIQYLGKA